MWSQTADTFAHTSAEGVPAGAVVRVLDGGEITHRFETDVPCFSCALGGPGATSMSTTSALRADPADDRFDFEEESEIRPSWLTT